MGRWAAILCLLSLTLRAPIILAADACGAHSQSGIEPGDDFPLWPDAVDGSPGVVRLDILANDQSFGEGSLAVVLPLSANFNTRQLAIVDNGAAILVQPATTFYPSGQPTITYTVRGSSDVTAQGHVYFQRGPGQGLRGVNATYNCRGTQCLFTAAPTTNGVASNPAEVRSYAWTFQTAPQCNQANWRGQTTYCEFTDLTAPEETHTSQVRVVASFHSGETAEKTIIASYVPSAWELQWACDNLHPAIGMHIDCHLSVNVGHTNLEDRIFADWTSNGALEGPFQYSTANGNASFDHWYPLPGTYTAKLVGFKSGVRYDFPLTLEIKNAAPTVDSITAVASDPDRYQFFATIKDDGGGERIHEWNFGDGSFQTQRSTPLSAATNHTFPRSGDYTVSLTVTDQYGASSTTSKQLTVLATRPHPNFTIDCTTSTSCVFDASTTASERPVTRYYWTIDGAESSTTAPSLVRNLVDGQHAVSLETVTDWPFNTRERATRQVGVDNGSRPSLNYYAVFPCRMYDSRTAGTRLRSGVVAEIAPDPRCSVPPTAAALDVNLVAIAPAGPGNLKLLVPGPAVPTATIMNFSPPRSPRSNYAIAPFLYNRIWVQPTIFAPAGTPAEMDLVVDVAGYYSTSTEVNPIIGGHVSPGPMTYQPIEPCRLIDSAVTGPALTPDVSVSFKARGKCGIPDEAQAVVVSTAVAQPTASGNAILFDSAYTTPPAVTTLNFQAAITQANASTVFMSGQFFRSTDLSIQSKFGGGRYFIDAAGYYTYGSGLQYHRVLPCRVLDTRLSSGGAGPLPSDGETSFPIAGNCGVPKSARAVALSAAVINPPGNGNLKLFAAGKARPSSTVMNFSTGDTIANSAIVELGDQGVAAVATVFPAVAGNPATVDLVVDVQGYFTSSVAVGNAGGVQ